MFWRCVSSPSSLEGLLAADLTDLLAVEDDRYRCLTGPRYLWEKPPTLLYVVALKS